MGKPNYVKTEVVRVQRLRGGSIELHGKFAGDIVNIVEDACLVDLRQVGHHTLKVTGGEVQEIVQRELPLTPKVSSKKSVVEELIADIAPPEYEQEMFARMVCKKQVASAMYDEDTGRYKMLLEPLKGGKGKSYTLSFISCQVKELVPGEDVTQKTPMATDVVGSLHWCLRQTLNNMEGTFMSDQDGCRVKMSIDRNIDRWDALTKKGASNQDIKNGLLEQFTWLIEVTYIEGLEPECAVMKRKGTPEFYWNFGKDGVPAVVLPGAKLVKAVRDIYQIPLPKKVKK